MPETLSELDLDTTILEEEDWAITCKHGAHHKLTRGHSDDSPVMAVQGQKLACCGQTPYVDYLCLSWIQANPTLRCDVCGKSGLLFEDCYRVLGPA